MSDNVNKPTTVRLPDRINEAIDKEVRDGRTASKSEFIREAVESKLDLPPEKDVELQEKLIALFDDQEFMEYVKPKLTKLLEDLIRSELTP